MGNVFVHSAHELVNPLRFELWSDLKQFLSMGRMFNLLPFLKATVMGSDLPILDRDLQRIGISHDLTGGC
jgi:hypothetical protein